MRTDKRYSRVLGLITDPVIPRTSSGGVQLCKFCQRQIYFAGGFMALLTRDLERSAASVHFGLCQSDPAYRAAYFASRKGK